MLSRRSFMRSGVLTALALGVTVATRRSAFAQGAKSNPNFDFPIPYSALQDPLMNFKQSAFKMFIGTPFNVTKPKSNVVLTLVNVTGYQPDPNTKITTKPPRPCDCYSLSFSATGALPTTNTVYSLTHAALG